MFKRSFGLLAFLCGLMMAGHAYAQLSFGVPPQKNMRSALVTYSPLVDYLARVTGQPVNMSVATGWFEYQAAIKAGSYDLLIAEPHIVGWLMDNLGFEPLVKFPSLLKYVVVVPADETGIEQSDDLVSRIVCSRPPPSLGILLFLESFENAFQQPALNSINGGDLNVLAGLYDGACDAALVSSSFVSHVLNESQRSLLKEVLETRGMVNEALVSSERIPFEVKDRIIESLTRDPAGIAATERIRDQSDSSASSMVPANMLEYSGLADLLQTQSFGW
jgi:ABC-type phosphate/phosphonate transport system substrate-binding protein